MTRNVTRTEARVHGLHSQSLFNLAPKSGALEDSPNSNVHLNSIRQVEKKLAESDILTVSSLLSSNGILALLNAVTEIDLQSKYSSPSDPCREPPEIQQLYQ